MIFPIIRKVFLSKDDGKEIDIRTTKATEIGKLSSASYLLAKSLRITLPIFIRASGLHHPVYGRGNPLRLPCSNEN